MQHPAMAWHHLYPVFLLLMATATFTVTGCGLRQGKNSYGYHFIGGKYIQLGISPNGKFLGYAPYPAGFLCCSDATAYYGALGLVGDADGFCNGVELAIDYFFPGSPAERFNAGYFLSGTKYEAGGEGFATSVISGVEDGKAYATITGTLNGRLQVIQYVSFSESDVSFVNSVTITNVGSSTLTNVRFSRELDPDNTVFKGGDYSTINTVEAIYALDGTCRVSAKSFSGDNYNRISGAQALLFLESSDPSCRAGFGEWYPSLYWTWVYDYQRSRGASTIGDVFIGMAFNRPSLAPGENWTFSMRTALTEVCTSDAQCLNGGRCLLSACLCAAGWAGGNCETDVNECNSLPSGCAAGSCINTPGSYSCTCLSGFTWDITACKDIQPPLVSCPSNIELTMPTDSATALTTWTASATDNVAVSSGPSCTPSATTAFSLGTTRVVCTASDSAGNSGECSFDVTVKDLELPKLTCPTNLEQPNDKGTNSATVTWSSLVHYDNDRIVGSPRCDFDSGSSFSVGETTVTCSVTDRAGNKGSCAFLVTIKDVEAPEVTCPSFKTQGTDAGKNYATVRWNEPEASDNVAVTSISCDRTVNTVFPLGATTVTCTASDAAGWKDTCVFVVTIEDNEKPVIACPENDITLTNDAVANWAVTATDNVALLGSPSCTPSSGSSFSLGTTDVTCRVADTAGNNGQCSFHVTVQDTLAPIVMCPGNIKQGTDAKLSVATVHYGPVTATDNFAKTEAPVCTPQSGSTFALGETSVTCQAKDESGNCGSCGFIIEIEDREDPIVACPEDIVAMADVDAASTHVSWLAVTATDNVGVTPGDPQCDYEANSIFIVGSTTVTCSASDAALNTGSCSFQITVEDKQAPLVVCPAAINQRTDDGKAFATVSWHAPMVSDNVDRELVPSCNHAVGSTFVVGETDVTCTAADAAGNIGSCSFIVNVFDLEPPQLLTDCPTRIKQMADVGMRYATVMWTLPTFSDNVGVTRLLHSKNPGDTFPHGTTEVSHRAEDAAGNQVTCTFQVTVSASSCGKSSVFNSQKFDTPHSLVGTADEVLPVTCRAGFVKVDGPQGPDAICRADGTWSLPTCTAQTCTPSQVPNSNKAAAGAITGQSGDRVRVNCDKGYIGSDWTECRIDGTFSPVVCTEVCNNGVTVPVMAGTQSVGSVAVRMSGQIVSVTTSTTSQWTIADLYVSIQTKNLAIGASADGFPFVKKGLGVTSYAFSEYIANLGIDCATFNYGTLHIAVHAVTKSLDGTITLPAWAKGSSAQNTAIQVFSTEVPCDCSSSNSIFIREALLAAGVPSKVQINKVAGTTSVVTAAPKFAIVPKSSPKTLSTGRSLLQSTDSVCAGVEADQPTVPAEDGSGWVLHIMPTVGGEFAICITGLEDTASRRTLLAVGSGEAADLEVSGPTGVIVDGQSCMAHDAVQAIAPNKEVRVEIPGIGIVPGNAWWMVGAEEECEVPNRGYGARSFGPGARNIPVTPGKSGSLAICYLHQGTILKLATCITSKPGPNKTPADGKEAGNPSDLNATCACPDCSAPAGTIWTIGLAVGLAIVILGLVVGGFWYRHYRHARAEKVLFADTPAPSQYARVPEQFASPGEGETATASLSASFTSQFCSFVLPGRSRPMPSPHAKPVTSPSARGGLPPSH